MHDTWALRGERDQNKCVIFKNAFCVATKKFLWKRHKTRKNKNDTIVNDLQRQEGREPVIFSSSG